MKGEILFSVQTFMGAKLLEHIAESGICAKDVSAPDEHTLNVWVSGRDEKAFRALAERFHLSCSVLTVRGKAKVQKSLRAHIALAAGLFAGIILVYLMSLRIWLVDASNAPDSMRNSLDRLRFFTGIPKSRVDVDALSRQLEAEYPEYAHIGVKISGVVLKINCVAAEKAPGVYDIASHRNLIAKTDGVIEEIDVFAGQAQVKPGDTVFKGDILILGEERAGKDGEVTFVRARGSVTARVWTQGESAVSLHYTKRIRTGKTSVVTEIQTPFFTRRLAGENPFETYESARRESGLVGLFIPVRLINTTYYELAAENASVSADAAKQIAYENALFRAYQKAPEGAEEVRRWAEYQSQGETAVAAKAVVEWIIDIATDGQGG